MKSLKDFNVNKKRILVRCDFNVPLSNKGVILDDFRIIQTIPTIKYLIKKQAKIILISHLGRPLNKSKKYSLKVISKRLQKLLGKKVKFIPDSIEIESINPGEIVLLENIRFYKEEENNNKEFAKKLAKLGDIFINDAFSVCHREHASIVGIPKYLPSGAGFLLEKEIKSLTSLLKSNKKPFIVIIGGKKVETKIKFIDKISKIADLILIGGLIARELKSKNIALKYPKKVIFPIDEINNGLDIGKETINLFKKEILDAQTIFWSGVFGKIEDRRFTKGSAEIAKAIVKKNILSVAGGGETVEFIRKMKLEKKFNHLSTGGGAMLKFLSGEELPGIKALK